MADRLKGTFQGGSPDKWANGKIGYMRYNSANVWYQFAGLHYEGTTPYQDHDDIAGLDIINFPIVSKGITAYVLCRFGKAAEIKIFTDYYHSCLSKFKDIEDKKPGAYKRNLDSEFYSIHISEEKERIKFSQKIDEYISENELEFVNNHTQNYLNYIEQVHSPTGNIIPIQQSINQPIIQIQNDDKSLLIPMISFNKDAIKKLIFNELKGYFLGCETELENALTGGILKTRILFPHNQNKFTELFKRLKYNGFLLNNHSEIKNWLCVNFNFLYKKGDYQEIRQFNSSSVYDLLSKGRGEPKRKERICFENLDWLPYKRHDSLKIESEREQL